MGIYIKIIKHSEENFIHYYSVTDSKMKYFIGLDEKNKTITFYKKMNFNKPISIFDVTKNDFLLWNAEFEQQINMRALFVAMKAIKENNFPNDISWCS